MNAFCETTTEVDSIPYPKASYFHLKQVDFFKPLFPSIERDTLDKLAEYSLSYLNVLLLIDKLVDEVSTLSSEEHAKTLFSAFDLQEQTVLGLSNLLPRESVFWLNLNRYKLQFAKANVLEKQLSADKPSISESEFENLAEGKSAVCYAIVDALQALANDCRFDYDLRDLLKHFHIAFQYRDDIDDFKKDIASNQYTYLYCRLTEELHSRNIATSYIDATVLYKYLFLTGIAGQHLEKAKIHFKHAFSTAQRLNLAELSDFLSLQVTDCEKHIKEINLFISKAKAKSVKNNTISKC